MTDIEADRLGPRAVEIALATAESLARSGDAAGAERWREKAKAYREYFEAELKEHHRKIAVDPSVVKLFAGVAGLKLEETMDIGAGLRLEPTFAHVMSPFVMAFEEAEQGRPHAGPWKSAAGGEAVDIHVQATLDETVTVGGFDRLNSIWFLASLLRLKVSVAIRVPVLSDTAFSAVPSGKEPVLWPIEFRRSKSSVALGCTDFNPEEVTWITRNIENGAELMRGEGFSLAMRTLDEAWFMPNAGSKMLLLWSAIETLFRPGRQDTTKVLSKMIATYLTDDPKARDREYQNIKELYGARGEMIHAARLPTEAAVQHTAHIARSVFVRTIENRSVPEGERLLMAWVERSPY